MQSPYYMSGISLILPICGYKPEYEHTMPHIFNFAPDGQLLCVKSLDGLDLSKFDKIYVTILRIFDERYNLSELLEMGFRRRGLKNAKVVILDEPTGSQPETVYRTIKEENITGAIYAKDADGYFTGDFTIENSIAVYPLDRMDLVSPQDKSYVALDDQFYITNIIEKKIIGRYFNAGGYLFADANQFCAYFQRLKEYPKLYMSHIVYSMLLDNIPFRPMMVKDFSDWGNPRLYRLSLS